nr:uncharacterized protein LOC127488080 [Oryctolagus cuniculus]
MFPSRVERAGGFSGSHGSAELLLLAYLLGSVTRSRAAELSCKRASWQEETAGQENSVCCPSFSPHLNFQATSTTFRNLTILQLLSCGSSSGAICSTHVFSPAARDTSHRNPLSPEHPHHSSPVTATLHLGLRLQGQGLHHSVYPEKGIRLSPLSPRNTLSTWSPWSQQLLHELPVRKCSIFPPKNLFIRQAHTHTCTHTDLLSLVHSPSGHNNQGWARAQQEPGTPPRSPTWVAGIQALGPPSAASQGRCYGLKCLEAHQQGLDRKQWPGFEPALWCGVWVSQAGSTLCAVTPAPRKCFSCLSRGLAGGTCTHPSGNAWYPAQSKTHKNILRFHSPFSISPPRTWAAVGGW